VDRKQTAIKVLQYTDQNTKSYQKQGIWKEPGDPNSQGGLQGTFQAKYIWMEPIPSIPSRYRNQLVKDQVRQIMVIEHIDIKYGGK